MRSSRAFLVITATRHSIAESENPNKQEYACAGSHTLCGHRRCPTTAGSDVTDAGPVIVLDETTIGDNATIREIIKDNIEESADYGEDEDGSGELESDEDDDPDDDDEDDT